MFTINSFRIKYFLKKKEKKKMFKSENAYKNIKSCYFFRAKVSQLERMSENTITFVSGTFYLKVSDKSL